LVLLWLNAVGACRLLAELQKLANMVPELAQLLITGLGKVDWH
jgi:hypothetical protein